jgi:hypothetical protein
MKVRGAWSHGIRRMGSMSMMRVCWSMSTRRPTREVRHGQAVQVS